MAARLSLCRSAASTTGLSRAAVSSQPPVAKINAISRDVLQPCGRAEALSALQCRRTVSVCAALKRAKRGRFAYFALESDVPFRAMGTIGTSNGTHIGHRREIFGVDLPRFFRFCAKIYPDSPILELRANSVLPVRAGWLLSGFRPRAFRRSRAHVFSPSIRYSQEWLRFQS
jgi:hypothetical protein